MMRQERCSSSTSGSSPESGHPRPAFGKATHLNPLSANYKFTLANKVLARVEFRRCLRQDAVVDRFYEQFGQRVRSARLNLGPDPARVRDPPQSAPAAPLAALCCPAETATTTGHSRPVPRTKADSHRGHDQRISPGRVTWMRLSAPTGLTRCSDGADASPGRTELGHTASRSRCSTHHRASGARAASTQACDRHSPGRGGGRHSRRTDKQAADGPSACGGAPSEQVFHLICVPAVRRATGGVPHNEHQPVPDPDPLQVRCEVLDSLRLARDRIRAL